MSLIQIIGPKYRTHGWRCSKVQKKIQLIKAHELDLVLVLESLISSC
jgi:hypothetical protein